MPTSLRSLTCTALLLAGYLAAAVYGMQPLSDAELDDYRDNLCAEVMSVDNQHAFRPSPIDGTPSTTLMHVEETWLPIHNGCINFGTYNNVQKVFVLCMRSNAMRPRSGEHNVSGVFIGRYTRKGQDVGWLCYREDKPPRRNNHRRGSLRQSNKHRRGSLGRSVTL